MTTNKLLTKDPILSFDMDGAVFTELLLVKVVGGMMAGFRDPSLLSLERLCSAISYEMRKPHKSIHLVKIL